MELKGQNIQQFHEQRPGACLSCSGPVESCPTQPSSAGSSAWEGG